MRMRAVSVLLVLGMVSAVFAPPVAARETGPVVRGVLFFSPTCPHCEYVIEEVLPPLFDEHGGEWRLVFDESLPPGEVAYYLVTNGTLELLFVDVTVDEGSAFFDAVTEELSIGSTGVPRLVVSNQVLIGSVGIPERLPGIVEKGFETGGIAWPALPGIESILATFAVDLAPYSTTTSSSPTTTTVDPAVTAAPAFASEEPRGFGDDPLGNSLAVVVLVGLLASLGMAAMLLLRDEQPYRPIGLVPILVAVGLAVAGYLTHVELSDADAVCGPVGDCRLVQQSDYATVAGIPIGVVGLIGYLLVGALWAVRRRQPGRRADLASVGVGVVAAVGAAFSAWLTFLEPFVIHATCAWCIGSAVVIATLLWLTAPQAIEAWRRVAPSDVEELVA